nr:reverse transcriptase domain-containing protein [Tanacetum cinerariifolium]
EGPPVIEAEIGGHTIHRMYIDGGSSMEILYEHCFNRLRPDIKKQMVPATTSLTGFSGETTWPLRQLKLLVTIGDATHSTKSMDELYDCEVAVTLQRHHWTTGIKSNSSSTIHRPWDAQIPNLGRGCNNPQLPTDTCRMRVSKCIVRDTRRKEDPPHQPYGSTTPKLPRSRSGSGRIDCYPLPEIDWKVESLCGYPFKCFLDAYKGYHQIQMAAADEEKTAFHTGQGVYCYTKMPFGLKNAGATYQRLMDKAFENKMGRNIEVYVDDLVIKSHNESEMVRDIAETFQTLRKINMKLNPKKCSFGLAEGVFLGYVITPEGIKPCPDKTSAVLQLPSPQTIKEVQSLNGKLANLNRFLSKSAKKSLPLFQTLKKCIKKSDFRWTTEAEHAFQQLKQHLSALPLDANGGKNIQANVDSKLVANQVLGTYVAKEDNMIKYLEIAKSLVSGFKTFSISQVPRSKNKKADALSKIASTSFAHLSKQVLVEVLKTKSITGNEVTAVIEEEGPTWMMELVSYLKEGTLPADEKEARKIRLKARQY